MVCKKYQTIYTFPHPVSYFHHAPGRSHCYPSNPSYPVPFQVPLSRFQHSVSVNNAQVAIIVAYSQNPAVLSPKNLSASLQTPHDSATSDVFYTHSLHPSHFGTENSQCVSRVQSQSTNIKYTTYCVILFVTSVQR